jgi:hypothetical protein
VRENTSPSEPMRGVRHASIGMLPADLKPEVAHTQGAWSPGAKRSGGTLVLCPIDRGDRRRLSDARQLRDSRKARAVVRVALIDDDLDVRTTAGQDTESSTGMQSYECVRVSATDEELPALTGQWPSIFPAGARVSARRSRDLRLRTPVRTGGHRYPEARQAVVIRQRRTVPVTRLPEPRLRLGRCGRCTGRAG